MNKEVEKPRRKISMKFCPKVHTGMETGGLNLKINMPHHHPSNTRTFKKKKKYIYIYKEKNNLLMTSANMCQNMIAVKFKAFKVTNQVLERYLYLYSTHDLEHV
jgi:hypothetical protein